MGAAFATGQYYSEETSTTATTANLEAVGVSSGTGLYYSTSTEDTGAGEGHAGDEEPRDGARRQQWRTGNKRWRSRRRAKHRCRSLRAAVVALKVCSAKASRPHHNALSADERF